MLLLKLLHFLVLVCLPLYIVRFSIGGIPFTLLEALILIAVGVTLVWAIKEKTELSKFRTSFDLLIIIIIFSATISLFITPDLRGGLGIFRAYFIEPVLFFYSLVFVCRQTKSYQFILWGLVTSVLMVGVLGFVQKLTGLFVFAEHEMVLDRISAVYNSANSLALFIGPIIPLLVVLFISLKNKLKKSIVLVAVLFLSLIMFWTRSRGGMLAEVGSLGLVVYGLIAQRFVLLKKLLILIPLVFFVSVGIFFWQVNQIYDSTIKDDGIRIENDTLQIRYATWSSTVTILQHHTLFGTGLNGFKQVYDNYKLADFQEDLQYPHTLLFNFWTETGLLGMISFLGLLFYCFMILLLNQKKNSDLLSLGLIGAFGYIVIHGLVDVPYFKNDLSVQFWSLVALVEFKKLKVKS